MIRIVWYEIITIANTQMSGKDPVPYTLECLDILKESLHVNIINIINNIKL